MPMGKNCELHAEGGEMSIGFALCSCYVLPAPLRDRRATSLRVPGIIGRFGVSFTFIRSRREAALSR